MVFDVTFYWYFTPQVYLVDGKQAYLSYIKKDNFMPFKHGIWKAFLITRPTVFVPAYTGEEKFAKYVIYYVDLVTNIYWEIYMLCE